MLNIPIILLFTIGLWGVLSGRSFIKKIIGLTIVNASIVMLFVLGGISGGKSAPILATTGSGPMVDPLPQALMLTAIVVGLSVNALALILTVGIHHCFGSKTIEEIEKEAEEESHESGF